MGRGIEGMDTPLSRKLLDLGFFSALGTTQHFAGGEGLVERGTPYTTDQNNGVVVVYDEKGWPWIVSASEYTDASRRYLGDEVMNHGAHVPHSNDGGHFVRDVLPYLLGLGKGPEAA